MAAATSAMACRPEEHCLWHSAVERWQQQQQARRHWGQQRTASQMLKLPIQAVVESKNSQALVVQHTKHGGAAYETHNTPCRTTLLCMVWLRRDLDTVALLNTRSSGQCCTRLPKRTTALANLCTHMQTHTQVLKLLDLHFVGTNPPPSSPPHSVWQQLSRAVHLHVACSLCDLNLPTHPPVHCAHRHLLWDACKEGRDACLVCALAAGAQHAADHDVANVQRVDLGLLQHSLEHCGQQVNCICVLEAATLGLHGRGSMGWQRA